MDGEQTHNNNNMSHTAVNPYAKSRKRPRPQNDHNQAAIPPVHNNNNNNKQQQSDASALIISASDKAGMEGIDRSKINAIILRESGNSLFMQQQRRRDTKVNQRIQQLQTKLHNCKDPLTTTPELELQLQEYQAQQPNRSTKVVVDMDMFYMACELLSKPQLAKVPACVGSGMILTSNYQARRYGVRSAMAGFVGDKLVEELTQGQERLIHVKANFELYQQKSKQVLQVLKEYDPNLKSYSLDEAYLDLGPYLALYLQRRSTLEHQQVRHESIRASLTSIGENTKPPTQKTVGIPSSLERSIPGSAKPAPLYIDIMQSFSLKACQQAVTDVIHHLRAQVTQATGGLTCSAGIAPNFGLAKIASDKNKPNGQLFIDPFGTLEFVHPLPVRKIPGIGRVTEKILHHVCQVTDVEELYQQRGLIQWLFQPATAGYLLRASVGCFESSTSDPSDVEEESNEQKCISRERTFAPERDWNQLQSRLNSIAHMLSQDMAKKQVMAHTITVKVKLNTFDVWSRAKSLDRNEYIHAPEELLAVARELLVNLKAEISQKQEFCCRLLGIRCSSLLHEDSLVQQKPMDKFLTKKSKVETIPKVTGTKLDVANDDDDAKQDPTTPTSTAKNTRLDNKVGVDCTSNTNDCGGDRRERNLCPLCNMEIIGDNETLNRHVDTCLNASTVRQVVKEVSSLPPAKKKNRQRLTDFW
jgi:DNA polymerase kappa